MAQLLLLLVHASSILFSVTTRPFIHPQPSELSFIIHIWWKCCEFVFCRRVYWIEIQLLCTLMRTINQWYLKFVVINEFFREQILIPIPSSPVPFPFIWNSREFSHPTFIAWLSSTDRMPILRLFHAKFQLLIIIHGPSRAHDNRIRRRLKGEHSTVEPQQFHSMSKSHTTSWLHSGKLWQQGWRSCLACEFLGFHAERSAGSLSITDGDDVGCRPIKGP